MVKVKVVILVGGPSKGTRFRPLSLEVPKPLVPVVGKPLIWHHLHACQKLEGVMEVLLLGFYDESKEWTDFMKNVEAEMGLKVRYLKEEQRLGTAGGLNQYRKEILSGNPDYFLVLHCDVLCAFPLAELLQYHQTHGKECTLLGKKVPAEEAMKHYGCLAVDPKTNEVLHYAEKPETFVSDIINCGVYVFSPSFFNLIDTVASHIKRRPDQDPHYLQLEQDLFVKMGSEQHMYLFQTQDFWLQLKSAGDLIKCSENVLSQMRHNEPSSLAKPGDAKTSPGISGNVYIHPTAKVHPTAKLGPNATIGANAVIGAGVRISHSIVLDNASIGDHSCILYSIIGWNVVVGRWVRLEGVPEPSSSKESLRSNGITILGSGVKAASEIVIRRSIVLPHKDLNDNYDGEILL